MNDLKAKRLAAKTEHAMGGSGGGENDANKVLQDMMESNSEFLAFHVVLEFSRVRVRGFENPKHMPVCGCLS